MFNGFPRSNYSGVRFTFGRVSRFMGTGLAAIPTTHAEAIGQTWPVPITPTARRRRLTNTPQAGEILKEIGSGCSAFGGFGHPGGNLAGSGEVLRGQDGAKLRN